MDAFNYSTSAFEKRLNRFPIGRRESGGVRYHFLRVSLGHHAHVSCPDHPLAHAQGPSIQGLPTLVSGLVHRYRAPGLAGNFQLLRSYQRLFPFDVRCCSLNPVAVVAAQLEWTLR